VSLFPQKIFIKGHKDLPKFYGERDAYKKNWKQRKNGNWNECPINFELETEISKLI
jgi:hypothetical protein